MTEKLIIITAEDFLEWIGDLRHAYHSDSSQNVMGVDFAEFQAQYDPIMKRVLETKGSDWVQAHSIGVQQLIGGLEDHSDKTCFGNGWQDGLDLEEGWRPAPWLDAEHKALESVLYNKNGTITALKTPQGIVEFVRDNRGMIKETYLTLPNGEKQLVQLSSSRRWDIERASEIGEVRAAYRQAGKVSDLERLKNNFEEVAEQAKKEREAWRLWLDRKQRQNGIRENLKDGAKSLATSWLVLMGAYKLGKQFRTYDDVGYEMGTTVIDVDENKIAPAVARANALLGIGGLTVAGTGLAVAGGVIKNAPRTAKMIPVLGVVLNAGAAIPRALRNDWTGVKMELTAAGLGASAVAAGSVGVAGAVPSGGTSTVLAAAAPALQTASFGMNVAIAVRDGVLKNGAVKLAMVDEKGNIIYQKDRNGKPKLDEKGNPVAEVGAVISYDHDMRNGDAAWYGLDQNGNHYVAQTGQFKNDKKDDEWLTMSEDGRILEMANFKDGKLVGEYIRRDAQGNVVCQGNYTTGHVVEYWVDENGIKTDKIKWEGSFKDGKPVGVRLDFDRNGVPASRIDYDNCTMEFANTDRGGDVILRDNGIPIVYQQEFTKDENGKVAELKGNPRKVDLSIEPKANATNQPLKKENKKTESESEEHGRVAMDKGADKAYYGHREGGVDDILMENSANEYVKMAGRKKQKHKTTA